MSGKGNNADSLSWPLMMTIIIVLGIGALLLSQNALAQGRGKGRKMRRNVAARVQRGEFVKGEPIALKGESSGNINEAPETKSEWKQGPATINFNGDRFTLTAGGNTLPGKLSVRTRSKNPRNLSLSVNLTFDSPAPMTPPIFSLSLRGCKDISDNGCDNPRMGPGVPDSRLRLTSVINGELQSFSFISDSSCMLTASQ